MYIWQMSRITFDKIGRIWCGRNLDEEPRIVSFPSPHPGTRFLGPFNSSSDYLNQVTEGFLDYQRCLEKGPGVFGSPSLSIRQQKDQTEEWQTYSDVFANVIPDMIKPSSQHGLFPLFHHNLGHHNILVDENFNITAVLDWESVRTTSAEAFTVYREFTTYPMVIPKERNRPILSFRDLFVDQLQRIEALPSSQEGGSENLSNIFASNLPEIYHCWLRASSRRAPVPLKRSAREILLRLYGPSTTLSNYRERQKSGVHNRLLGRSGRTVVMWPGWADIDEPVEVDLSADSDFQVRGGSEQLEHRP